MQYKKYDALEEAERDISYAVLDPDPSLKATLGLSRSSFVRWMDSDTDLVAFLYVGMEPLQGKAEKVRALVGIFQGHGPRCEPSTVGAPPDRHGAFGLPDGRQATWGIGGPRTSWKAGFPVWVSWRSKDSKNWMRAEGVNYELDDIRAIATSLSRRE